MKSPSSTSKNILKRIISGDPLIGTDLVSDNDRPYKIMEKVGEGGMGSVYKAHDYNGKEVAVKVTILEQGIARFKLETAILKLLGKHPNLPELFDWGLEKSEIKFCVMEFLQGEMLDRVIQKQADWFYRAPLWNSIDIGINILQGLSHVHKKKVVHRDIKPHNIIIDRSRVTSDGQTCVKLMDFGVSKILENIFVSFIHKTISFDEKSLTMPGQPIGTLGYAPREQLDNSTLSESADIFAFGITMLEMLHGHFVLMADTLSCYLRVLDSYTFTPVVFPGESEYVVGRLNVILKRALARDHKDRYSRAGRMLKDLEPLRKELAIKLKKSGKS